MQIAPIGVAEIALANLSTGMTAQQAVAAATAAKPGGTATTAMREKQEVAKAKQVEKSEQASSAGQQVTQARSPYQPAVGVMSTRAEAAGVLTERQLFDYLAEAERSGSGRFSSPTELFGSALQSLDSTMQQIQDVLSKARPEAATASGAGDQSVAETAGTGPTAEINENDPAKLLERSISVMWAAANLEVVVSSVTAVSSSAGTLVKQQ